MGHLILIRHGQSMWNQLNLFTGWVDVPLSEGGVQEAIKAGQKISHLTIDRIFTSSLIRAQMTAMLVMTQHKSRKVPLLQHQSQAQSQAQDHDKNKMVEWAKSYGSTDNTIPVHSRWELNERMYGELQGLNKEETAKKFGDNQVHIWRRSYDVPPPHGESLKNTIERCLPLFHQEIFPYISKGENILIAAHGNSLRGLIMYLENLTPEEILKLELPTGEPFLYDFLNGKFIKKKI